MNGLGEYQNHLEKQIRKMVWVGMDSMQFVATTNRRWGAKQQHCKPGGLV